MSFLRKLLFSGDGPVFFRICLLCFRRELLESSNIFGGWTNRRQWVVAIYSQKNFLVSIYIRFSTLFHYCIQFSYCFLTLCSFVSHVCVFHQLHRMFLNFSIALYILSFTFCWKTILFSSSSGASGQIKIQLPGIFGNIHFTEQYHHANNKDIINVLHLR